MSCGATRGTLRLFHGDILGAFAFQPMMMTIYAALLIWGFTSLWGVVNDKRVVIQLSDSEDLIFKMIVVVIPLLNWVYLWRMGI